MSHLCAAVSERNLDLVNKLLAERHDPNAERCEWGSGYEEDESQPNTPLKVCMFVLSNSSNTEEDLERIAEITKVLLAHGADPNPALALAKLRYGDHEDTDDTKWEALKLVEEAVKANVEVQPPNAPLAIAELYPSTFSVLSYNVLIPNSKDGWWIFKMYGPDTPKGCHLWEEREKLLHKHLVGSGADILALQETAEWSIDTDWEFLREAGYDRAVYKKDRMRYVFDVHSCF